ncbi:DUF2852 domain-containing protein [Pseudaestuariivita sp.]|uniref:DUF2852 domain-containing protein n=1 Tax=Pseudaestuariivita sp. TaxID=2211669 RepID=UPI004059B799
MTAHTPPSQPRVPNWMLVVLMAMYTGFAIPVSIVALVQSLFFGVVIVVVLAYFWTQIPAMLLGRNAPMAEAVGEVVPQMPALAPTGNASFDAYRAELIDRLERERTDFDTFVTRLRASKDKSEFDRFMDARANRGAA